MTLPVRIRRRAELDIDEAYAWYEARAEGVGGVFLRSVDACFARIERHPEAHVVAHGRVRRARLHRFPYGVYYTIREEFIDVYPPGSSGRFRSPSWPQARCSSCLHPCVA